jgi:hypothetical protein
MTALSKSHQGKKREERSGGKREKLSEIIWRIK